MTRGGARPGAGRPPGRDLTVAVQVRCRESQRDQMRAAAARAGLSLSEYLRRLGLGEPLPEEPAPLPKEQRDPRWVGSQGLRFEYCAPGIWTVFSKSGDAYVYAGKISAEKSAKPAQLRAAWLGPMPR